MNKSRKQNLLGSFRLLVYLKTVLQNEYFQLITCFNIILIFILFKNLKFLRSDSSQNHYCVTSLFLKIISKNDRLNMISIPYRMTTELRRYKQTNK